MAKNGKSATHDDLINSRLLLFDFSSSKTWELIPFMIFLEEKKIGQEISQITKKTFFFQKHHKRYQFPCFNIMCGHFIRLPQSLVLVNTPLNYQVWQSQSE